MSFLPVSIEELNRQGVDKPDFVLVTGDAYVDHPSFGAAIIGRLLVSHGYSVGIIPQPDWNNLDSFKVFGEPKLSFLVTGGNIDSMVNHYSVAKKLREKDLYSAGGKMGLRPDRATIVYSNKIRECYKNTSIIIGGIEASLRRLSHYDYWDNKVRRSILLDSSADLLVYGMGEKQIVEIAEALESGISVSQLTYIKGTVYKTKDLQLVDDYVALPEYHEVSKDKMLYAKSFMIQYENTDYVNAKTVVEGYNGVYVVQNPPANPLTTSEFDRVYSLDYMRDYHPMYKDKGGVPAIEEVKFSIISNRGCFGSCNFCALTFHQGGFVQARSHNSIISEAEKISWEHDFKGYIHDVGGPTANFRFHSCEKQLKHGLCKNRKCLSPTPCKNLKIDHTDYISLLKKLRSLPRIKKVFVRSGIRFDYAIYDKSSDFLNELCKHHISGQLKIAPEHISTKVLNKMGKPSKDVYERFVKKYNDINNKLGMKQFIVPYLMSSHPASDLHAAIELAEYLRDLGYMPEQVQDFYPTPSTLSTCMYYTEIDPITMEKVYVPKNPKEKAMQRALIQYRLPQNYNLVLEALKKAGRDDLIGFDKKCLIRPRVLNKEKPFPKKEKVVHKKKTIRNVHKKKKK